MNDLIPSKGVYLNWNKNDINNKKIDKLYIEIIEDLIKTKKIEDYDYSYNIIKELDLENIILIEAMINDLSKILNLNESYINDYIKITDEDFYTNKNKINFYYILLKYILKNSIYIYHFKFILKQRTKIIELLKENKLKYKNINKDIKDKLEYILEVLSDSKYYIVKYYYNDYIELKEILKYYKTFLFNSKKEDINKIESIIKNNNGNYEKYLQDYDISQKINKRASIIKFLYNRTNYKNNTSIKEEELNKYIDIWNKFEKIIIDKDLNKINEEYSSILLEYFNDENNKEILNNIFKEDEYKYFIQKKNEIIDKKVKEIIKGENSEKHKRRK